MRSENGTFVPMSCAETLTLPTTVHGLFLTAVSDDFRFSDIPLTVSFVDAHGDTTLHNTTKITVVNATIPSRTDDALTKNTPSTSQTPNKSDVTPSVTDEETVAVVIPKETKIPPTQPVVKGYTDLSISAVGSGVLTNGVFTYTSGFSIGLNNAVRFDVQNSGTQTSGSWSFKTVLPSGELYESPIQAPLAPQAHVVFTLGFFLDGYTKNSATFTHTLFIQGSDSNTQNNTISQSVKVVR